MTAHRQNPVTIAGHQGHVTVQAAIVIDGFNCLFEVPADAVRAQHGALRLHLDTTTLRSEVVARREAPNFMPPRVRPDTSDPEGSATWGQVFLIAAAVLFVLAIGFTLGLSATT